VDLQATPTTTAVMMGSGMQRRERDIVAEQNVVPLSNSLSTMRLPLDACSTAAADATEATGLGPTVPATFDLVCSAMAALSLPCWLRWLGFVSSGWGSCTAARAALSSAPRILVWRRATPSSKVRSRHVQLTASPEDGEGRSYVHTYMSIRDIHTRIPYGTDIRAACTDRHTSTYTHVQHTHAHAHACTRPRTSTAATTSSRGLDGSHQRCASFWTSACQPTYMSAQAAGCISQSPRLATHCCPRGAQSPSLPPVMTCLM